MYTHVVKGFTVGSELTRRLGRFLTGFVGLVFDIIPATFWTAGWNDYFNSADFQYLDGTHEHGFFRFLAGYVGDILGYVIGGTVGIAIGAVLYIPDTILRGVDWIYNTIKTGIDTFANDIGARERFEESLSSPKHYFQKAYNIGGATIGMVIAAPFYITAKIAEFVFPVMKDRVSKVIKSYSFTLGGAMGAVLSVPLYAVKHLTDKTLETFRVFRNQVRSFSALVYAKTNQNLNASDESCIPVQQRHSTEFLHKVNEMNRHTLKDIMLGKKKSETSSPPTQSSHVIDASEPLICPITREPFKDPVLSPRGHSYERGALTEWVRKHSTSPTTRAVMTEQQIMPNYALKEALSIFASRSSASSTSSAISSALRPRQ